MSSLNSTRKLKALWPSCSVGMPLKLAVSAGAPGVSPVFRMVPVAEASAIVAPEALLGVSVNVSPSSSTQPSTIPTDTVFDVSPTAK